MTDKPTYKELVQNLADLEIKTEERLRFERVLTELSAAFVKIPANNLDAKVSSVIQSISEILGVDRTDFVQMVRGSGQTEITHSWTNKGVQPHDRVFTNDYYPFFTKKLLSGDSNYLTFSSPDDLPEEAAKDKKSLKALGIKSGLIIPYNVEGNLVCAIAFGSHKDYRFSWPDEYIQRLRLLGEIISNAFLRQQTDIELRDAFAEINKLKDQLQKENIYLLEEIKSIHKNYEIIGESDGIKKVLNNIEQVAETGSTVLILGKTGTGKEMVAQAIHSLSPRKKRAMVTVNCAGLPATLIENELFGREKGAYTGAISKQVGRFEIADGSTIFLDEIGELPMEIQVKLLRVLQQGQFERLGSSKTITVDVRIIAATNKDLKKAIKDSAFREDLFYRLNVFPIHVPPLRERQEDILPLTWAFVNEFCDTMGKRVDRISKSSIDALKSYSWPGNIRELRNVIERAVIISKGKSLLVELPGDDSTEPEYDLSLKELEQRHIRKILDITRWRIRGTKGAAEILNLKPTTLYSKMKKLGIQRPDNS